MAIWSPETGIVDWGRVTESYGDNFKKAGGSIHLNFPVVNFAIGNSKDYPVLIASQDGKVEKYSECLYCVFSCVHCK